MDVYFSDYLKVDPDVIEEYGAFNISLINDLPLFIDPFLLFNSKKKEYQELHELILKYLRFLRDQSLDENINNSLLKSWYQFPEIKQNWFGFCESGNRGTGLGPDFAKLLHRNLNTIFSDFGEEKITKGSHIEKLCLIKDGVGRDNISDFTTNLIHEFLLEYTQEFARKYIDPGLRKDVMVSNVRFNYNTETWARDIYNLPYFNNDYVLLTPKDILIKDEEWINKSDMIHNFSFIASSISKKATRKDLDKAVAMTIDKYPQIIDYYIKIKEENGYLAEKNSLDKVVISKQLYIEQFKTLINMLEETDFYNIENDTYVESLHRIDFLKDTIENNDGYKIFYIDGQPVKREADLQILYRLTWFATSSDVNREVNNGRGPVDFKVSRGNADKTLIEFKLASNSQLKKNLQNQVEIYERANNTKKSIKIILYFSERELIKVKQTLKELKLENKENVILIDARRDNKPSASKAS